MARDFNSQALSEKQLQKKEKIDSILAIKTGKINAVLADPELCEKKRTKLQQRMDKVLSRCEARKALIDMSNEDRRAYRLNARREKLQSKIAQVQVKIMHTEDADEKEKLEKKLKKFHEKLQSREKQDDSNDSQEDVKELKKQERETKKAQRKLERASNKLVESEAKKARRELGKEDKKKNKQEVNQKLQEDLQVVFELGDVQELYLDGNNMLFVPDCLRSLVFNNKKKAEDILCKFALDFQACSNVPFLHVMYDLTKTVHSSETFVRSSARPQYDTSDDALVEIASKAENPEKILFITSDRGLIERLKEVGAKVAKPKPWFNVAFSLINKAEQKFDNLNDMLKVIRESTKKKEETDKVE